MSKKEKIDFILNKVAELKLSSYDVSKKTGLTEAGVQRILKGISKNPHDASVDLIFSYLESFNTEKTSELKVSENIYSLNDALLQNKQLVNIIEDLIFEKKQLQVQLNYFLKLKAE